MHACHAYIYISIYIYNRYVSIYNIYIDNRYVSIYNIYILKYIYILL